MSKLLLNTVLRFLFPSVCLFCGELLSKQDMALCGACYQTYQQETMKFCTRCKRPHRICYCRLNDADLPQIHLVSYQSPVSQSLILQAKNMEYGELSRFWGRELCERMKIDGLLSKDAVLCYVPRAPESVRKYGTDQARAVASSLAIESGMRLVPILRHHKAKRRFGIFESVVKQKELSAVERKEAVKNVYSLDETLIPALKGKSVFLFDDVVTTGATVGACAKLLKTAGASGICVVSIARS